VDEEDLELPDVLRLTRLSSLVLRADERYGEGAANPCTGLHSLIHLKELVVRGTGPRLVAGELPASLRVLVLDSQKEELEVEIDSLAELPGLDHVSVRNERVELIGRAQLYKGRPWDELVQQFSDLLQPFYRAFYDLESLVSGDETWSLR
jgi:hypothetical protein